jgi:hypothetical protein
LLSWRAQAAVILAWQHDDDQLRNLLAETASGTIQVARKKRKKRAFSNAA